MTQYPLIEIKKTEEQTQKEQTRARQAGDKKVASFKQAKEKELEILEAGLTNDFKLIETQIKKDVEGKLAADKKTLEKSLNILENIDPKKIIQAKQIVLKAVNPSETR